MSVNEHLGSTYAFVFPGQGSQSVGMGKELSRSSEAAKNIFERADAILDMPLSGMLFSGPEGELADTHNSQAAIFTVSIAALRALAEAAENDGEYLAPMMVAGHSLGQFSAIVAAEVVDFEPALRLVRERGRLMKEAGTLYPGGMAAVIGMEEALLADVVERAAQGEVLTIANLNCPGQIVISGEIAPLERAMEMAKNAGARKVARLPISIASHSSLMSEASRQLNEMLDDMTFQPPKMPIVANTTGRALNTSDELREELRHHVERGVNWTGTIETMIASNITTFVELGSGSVLAGLNRRIDRSIKTLGLKELGLTPA